MDTGDLKDSKTLPFSGRGGKFAKRCRFPGHDMVPAGGWQKVLRKSVRDKFQRPGRNSYSKRSSEVISTAYESSDQQALNAGTGMSAQIAPTVEGFEPLRQGDAFEIPTALLLYFTEKIDAYMRQQVDSC